MSRSSDALQARAEVLKLARILERDPVTLAYLEPVAVQDLRELRDQVTEVLWTAHDGTLKRLAAASRILPASLSASISERAFGPLITARLAGLLEPARAVEVATKLSLPFLADVAIELDPRRASKVIALIAPAQIAEITRELMRRGEYVTMGRFVAHLNDKALVAALQEIDGGSLLRVAFVLEDRKRLGQLISLLPAGRLAEILTAAAQDDLWLEALDLLGHLSEPQRDEVMAIAPELDPAALDAIVAAVVQHDLWTEVRVIADRDAALRAQLTACRPKLGSIRAGSGQGQAGRPR